MTDSVNNQQEKHYNAQQHYPSATSLSHAIDENRVLNQLLDRASKLTLPNYYFAAGVIAQSVWNKLHGYDPMHGIGDIDLVYYDPEDLSARGESLRARDVRRALGNNNCEIDIVNQARVHLWYESEFGRKIKPHTSAESAIATWHSTATAVGVRREERGLHVCAPYGLNDIFQMIVRPNKVLVSQSIYEKKANRWLAEWPKLTIVSWFEDTNTIEKSESLV